jgi:hypothetical protein
LDKLSYNYHKDYRETGPDRSEMLTIGWRNQQAKALGTGTPMR